MKKFLAGLALAVAAAVVLQKTWNVAPGRVRRRPDRDVRSGEPRAQATGMPESQERVRRAAEVSAVPRAADGGRANRQQPAPQAPPAARGPAETLNTATRQQLLSVYGIGPVLADRIIQNRPYAAAYDVVEKGIIPESIFVQLRKQLLEEHRA